MPNRVDGHRSDLEFYVITDQASSQDRDDIQIAEQLLAGGATVLQYRAKKEAASIQYKTALALRQLCLRRGVPFIVNDRIDLALAVQADGVHLGQDDLPLSVAREQSRTAKQALMIGKSTHTLSQALAAEQEGANYIGFGPVYATQTKENNVSAVGLEALTEVLKKVKVPVVAIGGIKPDKLKNIAATGAAHIAVVTHLTAADDVALATSTMLHQWKQFHGQVFGFA